MSGSYVIATFEEVRSVVADLCKALDLFWVLEHWPVHMASYKFVVVWGRGGSVEEALWWHPGGYEARTERPIPSRLSVRLLGLEPELEGPCGRLETVPSCLQIDLPIQTPTFLAETWYTKSKRENWVALPDGRNEPEVLLAEFRKRLRRVAAGPVAWIADGSVAQGYRYTPGALAFYEGGGVWTVGYGPERKAVFRPLPAPLGKKTAPKD